MQIDFYPKSDDCLLILTGLGGNTKGYQNKYVRIAENVTEKHNFSVFVAAVPSDCWENPKKVFFDAMDGVFAKITPRKLYIAGTSAGATIAMWYSYLFPSVSKILAVNPVLNLNYHYAKSGMENFSGERAFIVSGGLDASATWQQLIRGKENVRKFIVPQADHNFTGKLEEFISLPELLFDGA